MTDSRKLVLKETALVALGEGLCVAAMCGVYLLLQKFNISVLLGGLVGLLVATGNYFALAVAATLAAERAAAQDVAGGQKLMRSSYPLRLLAMGAILFLCAKSGYFDVIALVVPLLLVRPILTISEFFRKKGA